jgi:hypothetical protein
MPSSEGDLVEHAIHPKPLDMLYQVLSSYRCRDKKISAAPQNNLRAFDAICHGDKAGPSLMLQYCTVITSPMA